MKTVAGHKLCCPLCKTKLSANKLFLSCLKCGCSWDNAKGIKSVPSLFPYDSDLVLANNLDNMGSFHIEKGKKLVQKLNSFKNKIIGVNSQTVKNYSYLSSTLKHGSSILIIGGGTRGSGSKQFFKSCSQKNAKIDFLDVYRTSSVTIIADAHYLPFEGETFDLVIIQAVLEHVLDPSKVVSEILRVLKFNGTVYSEIPFLQAVHEGAYDHQRFTYTGHRWLFRNFLHEKSGVHHGFMSAILGLLSSFIGEIFSCRFLGIILRMIFSRVFNLIDRLIPSKVHHDFSSGTYFIGRKKLNMKPETGLNIIGSYKGAQIER